MVAIELKLEELLVMAAELELEYKADSVLTTLLVSLLGALVTALASVLVVSSAVEVLEEAGGFVTLTETASNVSSRVTTLLARAEAVRNEVRITELNFMLNYSSFYLSRVFLLIKCVYSVLIKKNKTTINDKCLQRYPVYKEDYERLPANKNQKLIKF